MRGREYIENLLSFRFKVENQFKSEKKLKFSRLGGSRL